MDVKAERTHTETKKTGHHAPKRGSAGYWFHIIVFRFYIPLALIGGGLTMILYQFNHKLALVGTLMGLICAFLFAWKSHHRMMKMSDSEYTKCFKPARNNIHHNNFPKDSGDPYDPSSAVYWTLGPGSNRYKNRH